MIKLAVTLELDVLMIVEVIILLMMFL